MNSITKQIIDETPVFQITLETEAHTENYGDAYFNEAEARKDFESIDHNEFENEHDSTNTVRLSKLNFDAEALDTFVTDLIADDYTADEIISEFEDEYSEFIIDSDDEYREIGDINDSTDELIADVMTILKGKEIIENNNYGRYHEITNEHEQVVMFRIADHSWNIKNNYTKNSNCDVFYSFVIANRNKTGDRFQVKTDRRSEEFYYNDSNTAEEIADDIIYSINQLTTV